MALDVLEAKKKLDSHIRKQRVLMYKPIQVAEILYQYRLDQTNLSPLDVNTYRTPSKRWRDDVTRRLVGRICTSSARFQDNLFEKNAMPPEVISVLAQENNSKHGVVEAYIYFRFLERLSMVAKVAKFLRDQDVDTFRLNELLEIFETEKALKKSIDKVYEIVVYSLFHTVIRYLDVEIELSIKNYDKEMLEDFEEFTQLILGIDSSSQTRKVNASIYRVGVTNAADKGLDMWTNFGPVVQVKHITLSPELAEDISESINADEIVIVCKKAEAEIIQLVLSQLGLSRIKGIVTEAQLIEWYELCFSKYKNQMGQYLLESLRREFGEEFPYTDELPLFLEERGYTKDLLTGIWKP